TCGGNLADNHRFLSGIGALMSFTRAVFVLSLAAGASCGPVSAAGLSVGIDMASPVRLERPAASVVVGNPAIADVQIQTPTLIVLQGRSYGTTNVIAPDKDGKSILSAPVTVTSAKRFDVTIERGVNGRMTYACSGRC